ncbi:hypothetical protein Gpo141_00009622 [Globisporangium polare]
MYGCHSSAMARLISAKANKNHGAQRSSDVAVAKKKGAMTTVDKYAIAGASKETDLSESATKKKSSSVMQSLFRGPCHH